MEQYIITESDSSLILMKDRAERVLQGIEQESLQLAKDPLLLQMIDDSDQTNAILWHVAMLDKLSVVKNLSGFINEIFFYMSTNQNVISNEYGVIPKKDYKYEEDIQQLLDSNQQTRWVQLPQASKDGYITFARMLPLVGTGGPKAILAFEIEVSSFSKFLEADTVIMTRGTELIILNYRDLFDKVQQDIDVWQRTSALEGIETVVTSDKLADRFIASGIDGKPAQFNYVKNVFSRTYVSIVPEQIITSQLDWIRWLTFLILISFVGMGVILTLFTARRAYSPVEQLMMYSRDLNDGRIQNKGNELDFIKACLDYLNKEKNKFVLYMKKIEPSMREKCLHQLLSGEYAGKNTLIQDCETYGIDTRSTNVVLITKAENVVHEKRFLPEERSVVAFTLANVMQEILHNQSDLRGYVIPYQGKGVVILQFNPGTDQQVIHEGTIEYANSITEALRAYLSFEVTVGIGRYYTHIADVRVSYKEAEIALQYRIFQDSGSILYIDEVENANKQTILRYPRELEFDIIDSLERGDVSLAIENFKKFAELLRLSQSYEFVHQSYQILFSSLIVSLDKQDVNLMDIMDNNLFGQLKSKQTFAEIFGWFEETFFPLYIWLTQTGRDAGGETGIQYIYKYIKENCGQDLSLVQCAEIVGVSPSYLSRLFKKETGMNFLDYVVECKLAEAKRLLRETDSGVSEIAQSVGYSERNLNRIFHRHVMLSPGNYRAKHR